MGYGADTWIFLVKLLENIVPLLAQHSALSPALAHWKYGAPTMMDPGFDLEHTLIVFGEKLKPRPLLHLHPESARSEVSTLQQFPREELYTDAVNSCRQAGAKEKMPDIPTPPCGDTALYYHRT
ncbi:hypothetical protein DSO57_1025090 [Entomophthora muscae]|uniref:Uncharacterized protein n=1 Tax=Entomophthora muscae TaxID=34485 RepID=A0ACC2SRK7_9FUNG|nr:hypothetical protein DSO57_1025090 [Entomophthora muscae]